MDVPTLGNVAGDCSYGSYGYCRMPGPLEYGLPMEPKWLSKRCTIPFKEGTARSWQEDMSSKGEGSNPSAGEVFFH